MNSLQGKFLVATKQLKDSKFFRSVVLLLEDDDGNSMGLVINRPPPNTLEPAFAESSRSYSQCIYYGGPVETSALLVLHNCEQLGSDEEFVSNGIFLASDNDSLNGILDLEESGSMECDFRVYCGYAGWREGQLQDEISRGDWLVLQSDSSMVFSNHPSEISSIWDNCIAKIGENTRILPPSDAPPEWN